MAKSASTTHRLKSPLCWMGGKYLMLKSILPLLPAHHIYVEPFGGAASILLSKPPSRVEIYNDLDSGLVNFWRVIRDPILFERFERAVMLTPYSFEEHERHKRDWEESYDTVERARRWFVVARSSFSGMFGASWKIDYQDGKSLNAYLGAIEGLPEIHARLRQLHLEHSDALYVIKRYDTSDTLFYCDPPYIAATRVERRIYRHEYSDAQHQALVELLLTLKGKVLLSGYQHPLYESLEQAGWQRKEFPVRCLAANRGSTPRTECLWINLQAQSLSSVKPYS